MNVGMLDYNSDNKLFLVKRVNIPNHILEVSAKKLLQKAQIDPSGSSTSIASKGPDKHDASSSGGEGQLEEKEQKSSSEGEGEGSSSGMMGRQDLLVMENRKHLNHRSLNNQ